MLHWLLTLDILDGPVPWIVWGVSAALALALLIRAPRRKWLLRLAIGVLLGGAIGYGTAVLMDVWNVFGLPLPGAVRWWTAGGFAALGLAIVSLWDSRWWRKVVAVLLVVGALLSTTVGINGAFGITRTTAEMLGLSTLEQVGTLPGPVAPDDPRAQTPVAANWKAPAGMPRTTIARTLGGDAKIPSTAGFKPRDASIYLPPAAQVDDPPALPVVVQMMGLPGGPTSTVIQDTLDAFAAKHDGLAPIVVIVDQLGATSQNPGCADTKAYGGVSTYINVDVPEYIRTHLRVLQDPKYWTISGYSNGGACSFLYGAEHPEIWGSIIDTSGEEWPGYGDPKGVLAGAFAGDQAAFEANKPEAALLRHPGAYTDRVAVFTAGAQDSKYGPGAEKAAQAATAAGFEVTYEKIAGAGHTGPALSEGLSIAFKRLYPRWGLIAQ